MNNKYLYIICHGDYEEDCNEFPTFNTELLKVMIGKYKQERKERWIIIRVFEIDKGLIYRNGYEYDDDTELIFDDCINRKEIHWNL